MLVYRSYGYTTAVYDYLPVNLTVAEFHIMRSFVKSYVALVVQPFSARVDDIQLK